MLSTGTCLNSLANLNQEIAALIRAGIPLEHGLSQIAATWPSEHAGLANRLAQRLAGGLSLPDALRAEGASVSPAYLAVVEAGLAADRLPAALEELAEISLTMQELRRRTWLAAVYPLMVCCLAYGLFIAVIILGVPLWQETREAFRLPPRFLFHVLETLQRTVLWWGPLVPIGLVFASALSNWGYSRAAHAAKIGWWIPGAFRIQRLLTRAQFSRLLAVLIDHALPAPRAFTLAAHATGDVRIERAATDVAQRLEMGGTWRDTITAAHEFPAFLRSMLVIGEQQGALSPVLRQAAETYQRLAERRLEWIRTVLPVLLVGVVSGSVVLGYCLSIVLPMFQFWQDLMLAYP